MDSGLAGCEAAAQLRAAGFEGRLWIDPAVYEGQDQPEPDTLFEDCWQLRQEELQVEEPISPATNVEAGDVESLKRALESEGEWASRAGATAPSVLRAASDPRRSAMTTRKTTAGRILTEADLDALADEVETSDYDIETLRKRRRGRPAMGSGPAEVVPVRIDPELRAAVAARAETDGTTTSETVRDALRRFLDVKQVEQAQDT